MASISNEAASSTGLLDLPPELRNYIYELTLVDTAFIQYETYCKMNSFQQPLLAKVNRQIRQEVLPVFYKVNTVEIWFDNTAPATPFSLSFMEPYLPSIRRLHLRNLWQDSYFTLTYNEGMKSPWCLGHANHHNAALLWDSAGKFWWASLEKVVAGKTYLHTLMEHDGHEGLTLAKLAGLVGVLDI